MEFDKVSNVGNFRINVRKKSMLSIISSKESCFIQIMLFMPEYVIDNIFVEFGGRILQQTSCTVACRRFLYSYKAVFVQSLIKASKKHLVQQFNFTYRYTDHVLFLKNKCRVFGSHLSTWTFNKENNGDCSLLLMDCYLYINNGKLTTRLYDKRDDSYFPLLTFHSCAVISLLHQHAAFTFHS